LVKDNNIGKLVPMTHFSNKIDNISIDDLINYNSLNSEGISIGQEIVVGNK